MQVFGIDIPLTLGQLVFFPVAGLAVIASVMMITRRDAVHSALWLVVTFFQLAIMYVMLGAEFLAVLQVLVYTGAILVLFLFVIMLLNLREGPKLGGIHTAQMIAAWPVGLILAVELTTVILFSRVPSEANIGDIIGNQTVVWSAEQVLAVGGNVQALGQTLYTQFLFPFEVASLILLMAVLGAIVLARKEEPLEVEEIIPSVGISVGRRSVSNSPQEEQVEKKLLPALGRSATSDMYTNDVEYPLVQQPSGEGEGTTSGVEVEPAGPAGPRR
ncbi:MAG: NADH-quinone oxidoreductase subunit [Chloroflexia bacterium]|jgi:NADH-quinone oxidoreductase subunit J|nr:NADH-quinone oxidoreductase subunit [Chloroflexia bacterium]